MAVNVFVSFRYSDGNKYKEELVTKLNENSRTIDFSEDKDRSNMSEETIQMYLYDKIRKTSVTIILLTPNALNHRRNCFGEYDDWMHDEIRFSLEDREQNRTSGLVAVYTKEAKDMIIKSSTHRCTVCNETKNCTTILDFDNLVRKNMFNIKPSYKHNKCIDLYDTEYDHYCQLVSYEDFINDVDKYINIAYEKRKVCDEYDLKKNLNKVKEMA